MVSTAATSLQTRPHARDIPHLTHQEAGILARTELARILALVESLGDDDWDQPTDCTAWNVRDMLAHLAGACAGSATRRDARRQKLFNRYMFTAPELVDGINRRQLEDRADRSPAELLDELRIVGPKAIENRQRSWWLVRNLMPIPVGHPTGVVRYGYLLDVLYTRDQWMHRADICRATGRSMQLTAEHDGRIVELVLRDLVRLMGRSIPTIDLFLTGDVELDYRFGMGTAAEATISLDLIEFNRLASGRQTVEAALEHTHITGNSDAARVFLDHTSLVY